MVDPKVFRSYDIRAIVPDLVDESSVYFGKVYDADAFQAPLEPDGVYEIGRGMAKLFGELLQDAEIARVARLTSEMTLVAASVVASGCGVREAVTMSGSTCVATCAVATGEMTSEDRIS